MLVLSYDSVCTEIPTLGLHLGEAPPHRGAEVCVGLCVQAKGGWFKSFPAQAGS